MWICSAKLFWDMETCPAFIKSGHNSSFFLSPCSRLSLEKWRIHLVYLLKRCKTLIIMKRRIYQELFFLLGMENDNRWKQVKYECEKPDWDKGPGRVCSCFQSVSSVIKGYKTTKFMINLAVVTTKFILNLEVWMFFCCFCSEKLSFAPQICGENWITRSVYWSSLAIRSLIQRFSRKVTK